MEQCVNDYLLEFGLDEAGAGSALNSVYCAAVCLPSLVPDWLEDMWEYKMIKDSKKLSEHNLYKVRDFIHEYAIDYSVAEVSNEDIDRINIRNSRKKGFTLALDELKFRPKHIIVDGDCFDSYYEEGQDGKLREIPHMLIEKGDTLYKNIAAASILAKCAQLDGIKKIHEEFPMYGSDTHHGYLTVKHRDAIRKHGVCKYHRISWKLI